MARMQIAAVGPWLMRLGGLLAAFLLPLWFNPWATAAFEPAKITLFLLSTLVMGLSLIHISEPTRPY